MARPGPHDRPVRSESREAVIALALAYKMPVVADLEPSEEAVDDMLDEPKLKGEFRDRSGPFIYRQLATPMAARTYQIIPSDITHVHALAAVMRMDDRREIESAGLSVRMALRDSFRAATLRRTAFVGPHIAAMWGLGGAFLSNEGRPWLLTSPAIERIPFAMVKEGRVQVQVMLTHRPYLENYVAASYMRACRFLDMLGFKIDPPVRIFGPDRALFHRFWMRRK